MLQVTDTIRSYELNSHPVPHGVTVSYERYTVGLPVCHGNPSDVFAASSGFVHLYILRFKEKEKRAAVVAKATLHKRRSVQRFKLAGRLNFQLVSGLYKNFTRMSPSEFEFLIRLEKKSRKRTQRSGKPFLFKKGWH
jgi:hypothetical protein